MAPPLAWIMCQWFVLPMGLTLALWTGVLGPEDSVQGGDSWVPGPQPTGLCYFRWLCPWARPCLSSCGPFASMAMRKWLRDWGQWSHADVVGAGGALNPGKWTLGGWWWLPGVAERQLGLALLRRKGTRKGARQGQGRLCCQWGCCAAPLGLNPPPCLAATCAGACCPLSPPSSSVSQLSDCWQTCQTSC